MSEKTEHTPNPRATKLRLAADIIENKLPFEIRNPPYEWTVPGFLDPTHYVSDPRWELRIKPKPAPWSFDPLPGFRRKLVEGERWHRDDFTEDMLPRGWRPLMFGEDRQPGDVTIREDLQVESKLITPASLVSVHTRTRRPLPLPVADADGWRKWAGGKCPVGDDARVEVRFVSDITDKATAESYDWSHIGTRGDILAFRIIAEQPLWDCAGDVPPNCWLHWPKSHDPASYLVTKLYPRGIGISPGGSNIQVAWADLRDAVHATDPRTPLKDWKPCTKEVK